MDSSTLESLKYPLGHWTKPEVLTDEEQQQAIRRLAALPETLRRVVQNVSDSHADQPYRPGGWTIRQLIHHIADSHVNFYIRVKLALTEDTPTVKTYDQDAWIELADVPRVPIDVSLSMLTAVHARLIALLEAISAEDRRRPLMHPEHGRMTIEQLMSMYAWHGDHHTEQIRRALAQL